MKILFLLPKLTNSGPSNVVASIISHPMMRDHDIVIASFLGFEQEYLDRLAPFGVRYEALPGPGLKGLSKLKRLVNEQDIDVVHSHGLIPDVAIGLISPFISARTVSTIHCDLAADYTMEYPPLKAKSYLFIHNLFLRFIQQRVSVSAAVQSVLAHDSDVVRNGVQHRPIDFPASSTLSLVFAGRLIQRKNVQLAIDCFNALDKSRWPNVELVIFGDGEQFDEVKKQETDRIKVMGFHDDFLSTLSDNSIFVNPSLAEGLPMAVIEVMAAGVPCLLSAIEPHKELKRCSNDGIAIFDFNTESFAQGLAQLADDDGMVNIDRNALEQNFLQNLSDTQMTARYLQVFAKAK
ncbi:glycosyltransferase family 4 protein [Thalassotalea euphylliae]|uniref:glycosyltransferase family 4 protein n=1 Tax=Thalassotalea euphylliae TaxID=1655234 RepID=UPI003638B159